MVAKKKAAPAKKPRAGAKAPSRDKSARSVQPPGPSIAAAWADLSQRHDRAIRELCERVNALEKSLIDTSSRVARLERWAYRSTRSCTESFAYGARPSDAVPVPDLELGETWASTLAADARPSFDRAVQNVEDLMRGSVGLLHPIGEMAADLRGPIPDADPDCKKQPADVDKTDTAPSTEPPRREPFLVPGLVLLVLNIAVLVWNLAHA